MWHPARMARTTRLPPYPKSLAGTLLAAREAVMAPIRPLLREANLTDQQWRVLRVLCDSGPLTAGQIARAALLLPPNATLILRELERRGLLTRASDAADRRRFAIAVTEAGRQLVAATAKGTAAKLAEYGAAFGQERLDRFMGEAAALAEELARFAPQGDEEAAGTE